MQNIRYNRIFCTASPTWRMWETNVLGPKANLFEPLSERVKQQFIAGAGSELNAPNAQSGNMYAVYSSSALCVNLFHYWSRLFDAASPNSRPPIDQLLKTCGLPERPVKGIDFEVPNIVNPSFEVAPHLDVQISFAEGTWKRAGIEAKLAQVDAILALKEK